MLLTLWRTIFVGMAVYAPHASADSTNHWFINPFNHHNQFTDAQVMWLIIGLLVIVNSIILIMLLIVMIQRKQKRAPAGVQVLIGTQGRALGDINCAGQAMIGGEIWTVFARKAIAANKPVNVVAAYGLQLEVEEIINGTSQPCMF